MSVSSDFFARTRFFPEGTGALARRRGLEAAGLALAAPGAGLLLAIASHTPGDPTLNHATDAPAANLIGFTGAAAADLALQWTGVGGVLLSLVLLAWGWRLASKRGLGRFWVRLLLLPVGLLLAIAGAGALPAPVGWETGLGFGGVIGALLLHALGNLAATIGSGVTPLAIASGLLGLTLLLPAAAISAEEWSRLGRLLVRMISGLRALPAQLRQFRERGGWRSALRQGRAMATRRARLEPGFDTAPDSPSGPREPTLRAPAPQDSEPGPRLDSEARDPELVAPRKDGAANRRARAARQAKLDLARPGEFRLPSLDLLSSVKVENADPSLDAAALEQNARLLESVLDDFGVRGEIVKVRPGPVVTLYELEPAPGTKSSRVIGLADDIARSMSAVSVRIAVVAGRNVIGIELPNARRETVLLRELLAAEVYDRTSGGLPLMLGKDIGGAPVMADLARMPHLLIAGTTGSGKSVAINTMICSLLYRLSPEACKFIMIDPKMLELAVYDDIPHLLAPVVTEPKKAVVALKWAVREMEDRYRAMSKLGVRNIAGYNARLAEARKKGEELTRRVQTGFDPETGKPTFEDQPLDTTALPFIVVIVDEMADLMLVAGKDIEAAVQRLAQMARAAGIHLVMATQRPSVDVITGTIKANFPTRISFQVTSKIDSRTILGEQGAEQLLGQGDMLYMAGGGRITRVHGPFVSDAEVEAVVDALKGQALPDYIDEITEDDLIADGIPGFAGAQDSGDALYDQAVALICREGKASTSFVQRHLQIGYNRAARIIEKMEAEGVISPANHVGKREILAGSH